MPDILHAGACSVGSNGVHGSAHVHGRAVLLAIVVLSLWPSLGRAQRRPDLSGVPVCSASGSQGIPVAATDGAGGAVILWDDRRRGDSDIYAQHLRISGFVDHAWPTDGLAVCRAPGDQWSIVAVHDGAGGVVVAWQDQRNLYDQDIYTQHVLASGVVDPAWPVDGLAVCAAPDEQSSPFIVADGAGGAIVAWADARNGANGVYAQHVLASGTVDPAWPADGRALCTVHDYRSPRSMLPDSDGGALVVWSYAPNEQTDTYAQHVLSSGVVDPAWPPDGLAIATGPRDEGNARMVADGAGGALIAFTETYRGVEGFYVSDIYAHHLLASGALDPAWPARGLAVCTAPGDQGGGIMPDGKGGAFAVWGDTRSQHYLEIYAQHVLGSGMVDPAWPIDGLPIVTGPPGNRADLAMASDGAGGLILVWIEPGQDDYWDIRMHHLLGSGTLDPAWPAFGHPVCTAPLSQDQIAIVAGAPGQAIVAWRDYRNGFLNADIYARRINLHSAGRPTRNVGRFSLDPPQASSSGHEVTLRFELVVAEAVSLDLFDAAGRLVRTVAARQELGVGSHNLVWDGADQAGVPLKRGVYLARLSGERESLTRKFVLLKQGR